MRVSFNPNLAMNQTRVSQPKQNPNFGQALTLYIEKTKQAVASGYGQDTIITELKNKVKFRRLDKQDVLDTLQEMKKMITEGYQGFLDQEIRVIGGLEV